MKLTVLQENLNKAISNVERFVSSKAQLPVLANVCLKAEKGRLCLQATNLETGITLWLGAKIEKEGAITVPARIFSEFISSLPKEKVKLELKDKLLAVSCGSFSASFTGIAADEFPPLSSSEDKKPDLVFPFSSFLPAIEKVSFAAARDEGRPVLTGVKFEPRGEKLILAATDGYRLSVKELKKSEIKISSPLIIPARSLLEILKIVGESEEENIGLNFTEKGNQIVFSLPNVEIVTRLIEGEFPEYQKIIPASLSTKVVLEKENFLKALKTAAIFARDSANIVRLKIEKNALVISANSPQVGENRTGVEAKVEGKEDQIAFNCRFLLEFLGKIEEEEIVFEMSGALNPGVFKTPQDSSYLHIIMPVRVQE
ncbi:DNA polymerase III subunit beta [Candidatus Microgenomates bacterium]|nr:DNA polymerase III subunit beta [Candidatus Microgenomates bacterium]